MAEDHKWNFGLEVGAFHNRLKVTADVYTNQTNNLLSEMYLPLTNGFPSYTDNVGKVKNKGVEVALSGYPIRNTEKNIIWSVSASFIHEKNEIVKISEALKVANEELNYKADLTRISCIGKEGFADHLCRPFAGDRSQYRTGIVYRPLR